MDMMQFLDLLLRCIGTKTHGNVAKSLTRYPKHRVIDWGSKCCAFIQADQKLAARLLNAYFTMFKVLLKDTEKAHEKSGTGGVMPDVDARILSAIITGEPVYSFVEFLHKDTDQPGGACHVYGTTATV